MKTVTVKSTRACCNPQVGLALITNPLPGAQVKAKASQGRGALSTCLGLALRFYSAPPLPSLVSCTLSASQQVPVLPSLMLTHVSGCTNQSVTSLYQG